MKRSAPLLTLAHLWLVGASQGGTVDNAPFADDLTKELYNVTKNECTSSLGVSMAMSLVYPAAEKNSSTELQMRYVLGYPEKSQSRLLWKNATNALTERYQGTCMYGDHFCEPTLVIANRIFVADYIALNPSYASVARAFVQPLDMSSESAGSTINQWVRNSTRDLIDSIVREGSLGDMLLVAVNSIYLKATWEKNFEKHRTSEDVFYLSSDKSTAKTSTAHFMHKVGNFLYSHEALPGFQLLQLYFAGKNQPKSLSMILVLPQGSSSAPPSSREVLEALPGLESTKLALALPKFKFESTYDGNLMEALVSLGMRAPFERGFCIGDGNCNVGISEIIQKTVIDVNEHGVEAAATTAISLSRSAPLSLITDEEPTLFQADSPFQFYIHDQEENLMLFEGQVVEPGITEGSEAPFSGKHEDHYFWEHHFGVIPIVAPEPRRAYSNVAPKPRPTYSVEIHGLVHPP